MERKSFCRVCHAGCGVSLSIDEDGRIAAIRGDKDNQMSRGYACFKGLRAASAHHGPRRLLHSRKRQPDGSYVPIGSEQAFDEIAERMAVIRERHGPEAIGLYVGGGTYFSAAMLPMFGSFLEAFDTSAFFTPGTIDQPNKFISQGRMGSWDAGVQDLDQSEVILLLGTNPLISHQSYGLILADATRRLKAAKARGMKMICIDPRFTETARYADLFLQPLPGQDPAILAGIIREILAQGWEDKEFCARHVGADRLATLVAAVDPFTCAFVEDHAGLKAGQIAASAALFARDSRAGPAIMTTGGSFAPFADLTQHLCDLLNIVCGRLKRAGDRVAVTMTDPPQTVRAQVNKPHRAWEAFPPSRIRGAGSLFGQKLTATLAEEILTQGKGQIRCLIMAGGNPASVVPDQRRIEAALGALDLSVTIDPWFTSTAALSDYVIAPKMMYERADLPFSFPGLITAHINHTHYTPAIIDPPPGSDVVDDWYVFWSLARRLGLPLTYDGVALDMETPPTTEQLLEIRLRNARVSFEELQKHPSGKEFDHPDGVVGPALPGADGRFDVMPADVRAELAEFLAVSTAATGSRGSEEEYRFLLISRRSSFIFNSTLNQLDEVRKRLKLTPAFIHPDDLAEQGVAPGEVLEIASEHGSIIAVAEADETMRRGIISVLHGVSDPVEEPYPVRTNVNALIDVQNHYGAISAMPRMSAIPVNIRAAPSALVGAL